ncbi:MAG: response regulator [Deltaproteobacteria bacterium]|nr:response regulator [Deltaproteobacteria bacterium]
MRWGRCRDYSLLRGVTCYSARHVVGEGSLKEGELNLVLVEDSEDDAQLILRELKRADLTVKPRRVQTRADLQRVLADPSGIDVVLCDYSLPHLDAPGALAIVRELAPDLPFIVVSGTIGEETAVDVMRAGANDFILKQNLKRLAVAVVREARDGRMRAEQRRAELGRQRAERSFRMIVESSPDLVVVHRDDHIVYVNPAALHRLGFTDASQLVGKPLDLVVAETRRKRSTSGDQRPDSKITTRPEQVWRGADGRMIPVEVVTSDVDIGGGAAEVVLGRDLTERDHIAAGMIEMDRMASIGILAAGVGHEINNPLAYVLANLEFVSDEIHQLVAALAPEVRDGMQARIADLEQALADTTHGAQRVRDIVYDLRTFSRGSEDKLTLVDVRQVLDSSVRMAAVQIRQRALIEKDYSETPAVLANESRLGQVFLNLVVNAAHAMSEGRANENRIRLRTVTEGDEVVVQIGDTGAGIAPEVLPRIFEPFFTTKPAGQGTGLGLSICRRIIRSLDGEISVTTEVGKGTTFTVRLPSAAAASERAIQEPTRATAIGRRARVLCVDDEPAIGMALRRALGESHDVVVLTRAAEACDRVAAGELFDVVLCDLMMPEMNGMALHAELTKSAPELAGRMIFLTGGAFTAEARAFLARIPNPRLEKPVGIADLRQALDALLRREG